MRILRRLSYALLIKTWLSHAYGWKRDEQGQSFFSNDLHSSNKKKSSPLSSLPQSSIDVFRYIKNYTDKYVSHFSGIYPMMTPIMSAPQIEDIFIEMSCAFFTGENNTEYNCESTNFTELQLNQCDIELNYTYIITNKANKTVLLNRLIDDSFQDLVDQSQVIDADSKLNITTTESIDICEAQTYTKTVVAIPTFIDSGEDLPFARDTITFATP